MLTFSSKWDRLDYQPFTNAVSAEAQIPHKCTQRMDSAISLAAISPFVWRSLIYSCILEGIWKVERLELVGFGICWAVAAMAVQWSSSLQPLLLQKRNSPLHSHASQVSSLIPFYFHLLEDFPIGTPAFEGLIIYWISIAFFNNMYKDVRIFYSSFKIKLFSKNRGALSPCMKAEHSQVALSSH